MSKKTSEKSIVRAEWLIIVLIFLVSFVTAFFYTRDRLESAGETVTQSESSAGDTQQAVSEPGDSQ